LYGCSSWQPATHKLGQVFNLAGTHTYNDPELARYIVETAGSESQIELIEDPTQEMVSVSIDKLRRLLEYRPERGEFLTGMIRCLEHVRPR
jgi:nucleoside-diphosphate-sugar epimerase